MVLLSGMRQSLAQAFTYFAWFFAQKATVAEVMSAK